MNTSGLPSPLVSAAAGDEPIGLVVGWGHPPTAEPLLPCRAYTLLSVDPTTTSFWPSRFTIIGDDSPILPVVTLHFRLADAAVAGADRTRPSTETPRRATATAPTRAEDRIATMPFLSGQPGCA